MVFIMKSRSEAKKLTFEICRRLVGPGAFHLRKARAGARLVFA